MSELEKCKDKQKLEQAIFATIAYYDYFNCPLTSVEIYHYLIKVKDKNLKLKKTRQISRPKFSEILELLEKSEKLKHFVSQKDGFCFLNGREKIIVDRLQQKKLTDYKFKKTKWILHFISYLPFVRLIIISGSMGMGNPIKESDIDLLIVSKFGRIWTTRAFLTFFTLLFGVYRRTGKTKNRLCLNHYITDKSLGINFGNLYIAEEYLNLLPLAGDINLYKKFFWKNTWIKHYIYSTVGNAEKNLRIIQLKYLPLKIKYFFEFLFSGFVGNYLEKYIEKLQVFFIERNPLTKNINARIEYDDRNLIFNPVLTESEITVSYQNKVDSFLAS